MLLAIIVKNMRQIKIALAYINTENAKINNRN